MDRNRTALSGKWLVFLWFAPLAFLLLFFFYPLTTILGSSLGRQGASFLEPFLEIIRTPGLRGVISFTFWQASLSTLLTLLVGLPGAYLLARFEFRGKSLLRTLSGIAFVMPTLVTAAAFNSLFGAHGWVNQFLIGTFDLASPPLRFTNTLTAILVAHVFYNVTIILRSVGDFWSHLDPRLIQAAEVLGATPWQAMRKVTVPLLLPAILSASLLVFLFDFTSFGVILVLGGPRFSTLETEIYYQTVGLFNLPLAAALALIQLLATMAMTVLYSRLSNRLARPLSLRPERFSQRRLTSWRSRLGAGLLIGLILVLLAAPLLALVVRSLSSPEGNLTLDYYRELNINRRQSLFYAPPVTAVGISLSYAVATVGLSLGLGLPAAWALAQDNPRRVHRWLEALLMLPLGASAVTLGLGFIIALDQPPLDLRASPLLIPLAHTLVALPFVVRNLVPALRSVRPRLRQAASILGANPTEVAWRIDLPLVGRAVLGAGVFALTISLGEFGATALIARPEFPTIPLAIFRLIGQPGALNYGQALALSSILMITTTAGMWAIERLRIGEFGEF